jgi:hypothetical protein
VREPFWSAPTCPALTSSLLADSAGARKSVVGGRYSAVVERPTHTQIRLVCAE